MSDLESPHKTNIPWYKAIPRWMGDNLVVIPFAITLGGSGMIMTGLYLSGADPYLAGTGPDYASLGTYVVVLGVSGSLLALNCKKKRYDR